MKNIMALMGALTIAACSGQQINPGQVLGAATGAMIGGYAGSKIGGGAGNLIFTIAGGVIGAAEGLSIGSKMLRSDHARFRQSAQSAMNNIRDGAMVHWSNPETGVVGTIKPVRTYYAGHDMFCREFEASIAVGDQVGDANGRACKSGGSVWYIDNRI